MFHVLRRAKKLEVYAVSEEVLRNGLDFAWKKREDGSLDIAVYHGHKDHQQQAFYTPLVLNLVTQENATSDEFRKLNEIISEEAKKYLAKGNKSYARVPIVIELASKFNSKSRTDNGPVVKEVYRWSVVVEKNSKGFHELKPVATPIKR